MSKHFNNTQTPRILYCQLAQLILEYGSIIWFPYNNFHNYDVEKVQYKFQRLATKHCDQPMPFSCYNYDIIFLCKIAKGLINCPDIINILSLNVPSKNFRLKFEPKEDEDEDDDDDDERSVAQG
ncbi:hypothetical protein M0802_010770 [Mischocyttarus mexicanus]|nr:hypothetical protein M0802_010770 [Mischocyttarus mexicanus]